MSLRKQWHDVIWNPGTISLYSVLPRAILRLLHMQNVVKDAMTWCHLESGHNINILFFAPSNFEVFAYAKPKVFITNMWYYAVLSFIHTHANQLDSCCFAYVFTEWYFVKEEGRYIYQRDSQTHKSKINWQRHV